MPGLPEFLRDPLMILKNTRVRVKLFKEILYVYINPCTIFRHVSLDKQSRLAELVGQIGKPLTSIPLFKPAGQVICS